MELPPAPAFNGQFSVHNMAHPPVKGRYYRYNGYSYIVDEPPGMNGLYYFRVLTDANPPVPVLDNGGAEMGGYEGSLAEARSSAVDRIDAKLNGGSGRMVHKLMKGAGLTHLLVPTGGRSAKWGFLHRMLGENKVKNKGKYKPANSLPKGTKMNAPRHFVFGKIKGRPIVSKFIDNYFNNSGERYLRANKYDDELKGKTTQEIKDLLHELIGKPERVGKKHTPIEYGQTMAEIRPHVARLLAERDAGK